MKRALYNIDFSSDDNNQYVQLPNGETAYLVQIKPLNFDCDATEEKINIASFKHRIDHINRSFIRDARIYGQYGWAIYDYDGYFSELIPTMYESISKKLTDNTIDNNLDKFFTKSKIKCIFQNIIAMSVWQGIDIIKIEHAHFLFKKGFYYEAAVVLFGIIDGQSIQILREENKMNGCKKQGLRGLCNVIKIEFGNLFTFQNNKDGIETNVLNGLNDYTSTDDYDLDSIAYDVINLAYTFKTLFSQCDWENFNELPATINRHCLAHGMYSYNDVTRVDCIKVILLLHKMLRVCADIRISKM